ncbi:MAG: nickel pincer cofactor biosynthesis protein LarC [Lachnospiraceae bacterium]|nr:nickel pincer cofactor biosynthesis protein LarC [Lachnospiraceae bacterium]
MKIMYIDCSMGAAGDMLTAALLELVPDAEACIRELNALGIPKVSYEKRKSEKCGIVGTYVKVTVDGEEEHEHHEHHEHHHCRMQEVVSIIGGLSIPESVKSHAISVYSLIAEAESYVHGKSVEEIHFHEVGTMDAIADVVAVCYLMERLAPEQIIVSPIHVGAGHVHCAHGVLPVPAPATAYILRDVPVYGGSIQSELCTPTGAALLVHFATGFGSMPLMMMQGIGYGMGKKEFERANCVRILFGNSKEYKGQMVLELSCNLDDMTPEAVGYAMECLQKGGALDVFTTPIGMKKNRPGTMLTVLCDEMSEKEMVKLLFRHTTTLGIRKKVCERYTLERSVVEETTPYGKLRKKVASGYGVTREKYEYEDLARIANEQGISLQEVQGLVNNGRESVL